LITDFKYAEDSPEEKTREQFCLTSQDKIKTNGKKIQEEKERPG